MIPIGAPVTISINPKTEYHGIIRGYNQLSGGYNVWLGNGILIHGTEHDVKMRYDSPAPFTLWQQKSFTLFNFDVCPCHIFGVWNNTFLPA